MSTTNYDSALKKVDLLLRKEPAFAMAHNLRGEILLHGFQQNRQARVSIGNVFESCYLHLLKIYHIGFDPI
ncbi:MAG: hypothetical protein A2X81_00360 [Desulfobacterales bacterium GWB2_56_26]|nr:MAG: hypothetical protein A2X81_00360 [Desulfobacterales bacterium GWB2_56_26]